MDSLPIDLIHDIFSRLPTKSIVMSRCVSKQWESILCRPVFTELFLTRPPRLFFALKDIVAMNGTSSHCLRHIVHMKGFDPIDKQFKVLLCMSRPLFECDYRILTLGTGEMCWRKIKPPLTHYPTADSSQGICIDGVLYYFAREKDERLCVIICFDVRPTFELCMWVLEDYEIQEAPKYACTFPDSKLIDVDVVGVTATGEIVLSEIYRLKPYYVFYFNPESNSLCSVKIQGNHEVLEDRSYQRVCTFVDYVEDLNFNMRAHLLQDRHRFESINKFDALSLLDDD
ncbi:hypothetical protein EUTSA_v10009733mg [Eutrema salsugineum]|uniref:F-box domain-containing protein n=1 Tax=Eutrema salsugineum TaxID=72664 RepID=V4KU57_EUTSA|nr:hypothetical protein EUTSA_v10009733mg [Eutrema salsugineum]